MRSGVFNWLAIVPMAVSLVNFIPVQPSQAATKSKTCHRSKSCHKGKGAACCYKHCKSNHDVVNTAMSQPDLKQFSVALKTAGLACCLSGKGPFTVFAPSDSAFGGQSKANQVSGDKDKLAKLLKYHIVKGKWTAADLANKRSIVTLEGESLMLNNKDGKEIVDGAIITRADIPAGNGIIHVIDVVLSPERGK